MIEKQNFRYRGPVESGKINIVTYKIQTDINRLINQTSDLLEEFKNDAVAITSNAKRRGSV